MDTLKLFKSKTREKILRFFLSNPDKPIYLRELARTLNLSAGNIRRELLELSTVNLVKVSKKGRLVYYEINTDSPIFHMINAQITRNNKKDIGITALNWVSTNKAKPLEESEYYSTRDILSARLEPIFSKLEKSIKDDAYLLTAVIGEIGNNSFDHNLGNWPDMPGIYLACNYTSKTIVLADRGQGVYKTIKNVYPKVKNHQDALNIAFTKTISGRYPEKRGNGLKFVSKVIKEKEWLLQFRSGDAQLSLKNGKMSLIKSNNIQGCLAVIKY